MTDKITDIRTSTNQLAQVTNLIIEALPDEQTPKFVIVAKPTKDSFVLDMFVPTNLLPKNFKQRIICSVDESEIRNIFNSGRFRLDGFEFHPGDPFLFCYIATYFR